MSTTNPILKGLQASWGIPSGSYGAGIVSRITRKDTGETAYVSDLNGFTVTEVFYDEKSEFSLEIIMDATSFTDANLPARGAVITITAVATCIVQEVTRTWEQKGFRTAQVSATSFVNLPLS